MGKITLTIIGEQNAAKPDERKEIKNYDAGITFEQIVSEYQKEYERR